MSIPPSNTDALPSARQRVFRSALRLLVVFAVVVLGKLGFDWLITRIDLLETDEAARAMTGLIATALIVYAVLIAIPFMPGIEIGIALLLLQGAAGAPFVYLATVIGLGLAFAVGHLVTHDWLIVIFRDLKMRRAQDIVTQVKLGDRSARLETLTGRLPKWLSKPLIAYRYVCLGLLINLPGNAIIGGGGGIMLMAGLTRLFHPGWMIATILLAVLPIPLFVWMGGGAFFS